MAMQLVSLVVSALLLAAPAIEVDPHHHIGLLGGTHIRRLRLRMHATGPADDLQSGSDKLAGTVDAVNNGFAEVRTAANAIDTQCRSAITDSLGRVQQQEQAVSALQQKQVNSAASVGRLGAELTHLLEREEQTKASYDSTVARRANERQAFVNLQATLLEQQSTVSSVLQMLIDKRTLVQGMPSGGSMSGSASGSSSGMDEIIGIFSGMRDELARDLQGEEQKQTTGDADLLALVNGYKVTLQHTDTQVQESQRQKVAAEISGSNAAEEAGLHEAFTGAEDAVRPILDGICGTPPGAHLQPSERALASFQAQTSQALSLMDELIASASAGDGAAGFLQSIPAQPSQPPLEHEGLGRTAAAAWRRAAMADTLAVEKTLTAGSNVSRQRLPAIRLKTIPDNAATQPLPLEVNADQSSPFVVNPVSSEMSMPHAAIQKLHANHNTILKELAHQLQNSEMAKAQEGFLALFHTLQGAKKDEPQNTTLSEQAAHCVSEKQRLTTEIVTARQQARLAREWEAWCKRKATATARWEALVQEEISALQSARSSAVDAWSSLRTIAQSGAYTQMLQDVLAEIDSIESDVQAYLASQIAPPRAQSLVITLGAIRRSTQSMLDSTMTSGAFYDHYADLDLAYASRISSLQAEESQYASDQETNMHTASTAEASVTQLEQSVSDLMNQRTQIEQQCEAERE